MTQSTSSATASASERWGRHLIFECDVCCPDLNVLCATGLRLRNASREAVGLPLDYPRVVIAA